MDKTRKSCRLLGLFPGLLLFLAGPAVAGDSIVSWIPGWVARNDRACVIKRTGFYN
jgi:hypothetical protein